MPYSRRLLSLVGLALALALALAASVQASCGTGQRIVQVDTDCLRFSARSVDSLWTTHSWTVSHRCPAYGDTVAKVVSEAADDVDFTLTEATPTHSGTTPARKTDGTVAPVPVLYCCTDQGSMCNYTDVVTDANCAAEFALSPAAAECTVVSVVATADNVSACTVSATCPTAHGETNESSASAHFPTVSTLFNNGGTLQWPAE